jgi:hypothetical protein
VKDVTDDAYATWSFSNAIGQGMLDAMRDKTEICIRNGQVHDPLMETSSEPFCVDSGGCDSFKYTDSDCFNTSGWVLTLDDDSYYCRAAFKLGRATSPDGNDCGEVDWGFLDDCECGDEHGELLFR